MADIEKISIEIEAIDEASKTFKDIQQNLSSLQEAMNKVVDMFTSIEKEQKKFVEGLEDASKKTKKWNEVISEILNKIPTSINNGFGNLKTKFSDFFKNLNKYTISRMSKLMLLRQAIRAVFSAMKEGMDTFHQYAQATGQLNSTGAITIDKLKQLGAELKVTLGQTLVQILTALYPLIQTVANAFNTLVEGIGRFFAWLNGTQWINGSKDIDTYVKSLNAAKKSILGFDEINKLSDNNSSGSSSDNNGVGAQTTDWKEGLIDLAKVSLALAGIHALKKKIFGGKDDDDDNDSNGGLMSKIRAAEVASLALLGAFGLLHSKQKELEEENEEAENSFEGLGNAISDLGLAYNNATLAITEYLSALELLKQGNVENQESNLDTATSFDTIPEAAIQSVNSLNFKYKPVMSETMSAILQDVQKKMGATDSTFAQATNDIGEATNNVANSVPNAFGEIASSIAKTSENGAYAADNSYANHFSNIQDNASKVKTALETGNLNKSFTARMVTTIAVGGYAILRTLIRKFIPTLRFSGAFANGGFPSAGELFIANEAGAELVGSMNGKTTVANQMEIIEGIKQGVMEAMQSTNISPTIEFTYKVDSETLYKTVKKGERSYNGRYVIGV